MSSGWRSYRLSAKCAVLAALLSLVPMAAWGKSSNTASASSTCLPGVAICIYNQGGMATGGSSGLIMNGSGGSTSSTVMQIGGEQGADLGTLSLTTGALTSGTLGSTIKGNIVTFAPGTINITANDWNGFSGVLFSGTLSGIDWIYTGKSGGFYDYTLVGSVTGTWGVGGNTVSGQTTQLYFHSSTPYTGGGISLASGTTGIVVPEQGTIGLMGTGLIVMGLLVRRKVKQQGQG